MFEYSISGDGVVKYQYDEQQLAVILAFLVCSLVSESATLDTTFGYSKHGASRGVGQKFSFTCERSSCGQRCVMPSEITDQIATAFWSRLGY